MDRIEITITFNLNDITFNMFLAWLDDYLTYQIKPGLASFTVNDTRYTISRTNFEESKITIPFVGYIEGCSTDYQPIIGYFSIYDLIVIRALKRSRSELYVAIFSNYVVELNELFTDLKQALTQFFVHAKVNMFTRPQQKRDKFVGVSPYGVSREELIKRLALAMEAEELHQTSGDSYKDIVKIIEFPAGGNMASTLSSLRRARRDLESLKKNDPQNLLPDIRERYAENRRRRAENAEQTEL